LANPSGLGSSANRDWFRALVKLENVNKYMWSCIVESAIGAEHLQTILKRKKEKKNESENQSTTKLTS
jgi:hypothetical protein